MAAIPYDVVDAFVAGKMKRRGSFVSTGRTLMSYAWILAEYQDGKAVRLFENRKDWCPSATTNIHMIACERLPVADNPSTHPVK